MKIVLKLLTFKFLIFFNLVFINFSLADNHNIDEILETIINDIPYVKVYNMVPNFFNDDYRFYMNGSFLTKKCISRTEDTENMFSKLDLSNNNCTNTDNTINVKINKFPTEESSCIYKDNETSCTQPNTNINEVNVWGHSKNISKNCLCTDGERMCHDGTAMSKEECKMKCQSLKGIEESNTVNINNLEIYNKCDSTTDTGLPCMVTCEKYRKGWYPKQYKEVLQNVNSDNVFVCKNGSCNVYEFPYRTNVQANRYWFVELQLGLLSN